MSSDNSFSTTFSALADPKRRAILARLTHGETSVAELSKPFAMNATAVTKRLKVLQRAGLVRQGRRAQYRLHWEERLDMLEDYLAALQASPANPSPSITKGTP